MDTKITSLINARTQVAATKPGAAPAPDKLERNRDMAAARAEPVAENNEVPLVTRLHNESVDRPEKAAPLEQAVENLNRHIQKTSRALVFSIDERYGKPVVSVVDKETDKVIRQIPSEVALQVADALADATGILVSEHA